MTKELCEQGHTQVGDNFYFDKLIKGMRDIGYSEEEIDEMKK